MFISFNFPLLSDWLSDVRKNNSDILIVPRFLFDQYTPQLFQALLSDVQAMERCARIVLDFMQVCCYSKILE
jgi:hypothetical protein